MGLCMCGLFVFRKGFWHKQQLRSGHIWLHTSAPRRSLSCVHYCQRTLLKCETCFSQACGYQQGIRICCGASVLSFAYLTCRDCHDRSQQASGGTTSRQGSLKPPASLSSERAQSLSPLKSRPLVAQVQTLLSSLEWTSQISLSIFRLSSTIALETTGAVQSLDCDSSVMTHTTS